MVVHGPDEQIGVMYIGSSKLSIVEDVMETLVLAADIYTQR